MSETGTGSRGPGRKMEWGGTGPWSAAPGSTEQELLDTVVVFAVAQTPFAPGGRLLIAKLGSRVRDRGPPWGAGIQNRFHPIIRRFFMVTKRKKPGPNGPGSPGVPPSSLGTHVDPEPNQRKSEFRRLNTTPLCSTVPDPYECGGVINCSNQDAHSSQAPHGFVRARLETSEDVEDLIGVVSWVEGNGMHVTVNIVRAQDTGPQRRWVRRMLADVLRPSEPEDVVGSDPDAGTGAGVREPVKRPPAPSTGVVALPVPDPEAEEVSVLVAG